MKSSPTYKPVADYGLLIQFGSTICDAHSKQVGALDNAINDAKVKGVIETVPALVNLLVIFDPLVTTHAEMEKKVRNLFPLPEIQDQSTRTHTVPVCYETELCPDLITVAKDLGLSVEAVINTHSASILRVSMYGFAPGYAYLSGLSKQIQVPRKPTILRGAPKGRVMIAGPQCLITTVVMPTGWSIIGRTAIEVIRDDPEKPFLFDVGDTVVFKRITRSELPAEMQHL